VEKALGACLQSLDPVTHIAQFPLKFNMGTRKSSVTIKFSMQLQVRRWSSLPAPRIVCACVRVTN